MGSLAPWGAKKKADLRGGGGGGACNIKMWYFPRRHGTDKTAGLMEGQLGSLTSFLGCAYIEGLHSNRRSP